MFKNLFDLTVKRSGVEVFGFYIVYSILGALGAGIVCGFIIATLHPEIKNVQDATRLAVKYAPVLAMFYGLGLALIIIKAKKLFNSFKAVGVIIFSIPILFFFGLSLGLVPIAFLTSFEPSEN